MDKQELRDQYRKEVKEYPSTSPLDAVNYINWLENKLGNTRPAPINDDTIGKLVSIALRYDLKHQGLYDYEQHLVCEILKILPNPPIKEV